MDISKIDAETLNKSASMLKAIAHPVRIKIIGCLDKGVKHTVTEIHKKLGIEQSTTSHHLGILKDKGVLMSEREGKNTWYFLKYRDITSIVECLYSCCR
jgi:DNA-binding transcriptional ArsR family regulator